MSLPAPTPLAARPTVALACIGEYFPVDLLRETLAAGAAPVFMHRMYGESGSADDGPNEYLTATARALRGAAFESDWGAGCVVSTPDEAAAFAVAGCTWFAFDLVSKLDRRASTMSLDALDAAIVALEDSGIFALGWHEAYIDREWTMTSGRKLAFTDEELARLAVKFGPALAHAGQIHEAIRTLWSGRGAAPDIELRFSGGSEPWNHAEFLFLSLESARRGLAASSITASLGPTWQPGMAIPDDLFGIEQTLRDIADVTSLSGTARPAIFHTSGKAGLFALAQQTLGTRWHLDFEEDAWLAALGALAKCDPSNFRRWLAIAQDAFPFRPADLPLSIHEEEIHVLPEVPDDELTAVFLGDHRGRQLLLATFTDVMRRERDLRNALAFPPP